MALYNYAIAAGFDQTALDNIEDVCTTAPTSQPLKWGGVKRRTLDRKTQYNGTRTALWKFDAITRTDFDTLLTYLGDVTLGSAPVTICTRNELDGWSIYNAYMTNPLSGEDWERAVGGRGAAEPLTLEFVIVELAFGELLSESGFGLLTEDGGTLLLED